LILYPGTLMKLLMVSRSFLGLLGEVKKVNMVDVLSMQE
jgi:hypothetical protein